MDGPLSGSERSTLKDNPCLAAALKAKKQIIPVFIWNRDEGGWSPGAASVGGFIIH